MNGSSEANGVNGHDNGNGNKKSLVDIIGAGKTCVWDKKIKGTEMEKFRNNINAKHGTNFETYWDLHEWSIKNYPKFWEEVLIYFDVIYSGKYQEVAKCGENLIDVDWFTGARMNYAENLLRHRDERTALICADEEGNEEFVTYAQVYEEVKKYAAAFNKLGLKKGDRVACYMANRQEAVYAMLGAVSLGGVWGGPLPFYGSQPASNIIRPMNPKFLITMDRFQDNKAESNMLQNVPAIVNGLESLIKVIIVPTKPETLSMDISGIEKGCFLHEFLEFGKESDGSYPEINFVQMPFTAPICINFTSGTTGLPKGLVHSAVTLLPLLRDFGLHSDITEKDVILTMYPVGWNLWNLYVANFALGATVVLYNGNPFFLSKTYYWDLLEKYKVTYNFMVTSFVDKMEKNGYVPDPNCNLQHLKMITIGASPVKLENFNFMYRSVKHDNLFVGSLYGATEVVGVFSGFDFNTPAYSGEIQAPALGLDLRCFDEQGNSVVGQRGELVIATPIPTLPLNVWNDSNNERLQELYFSKYKGVWCQNDECWIDPKTNGIVVVGRSDDTMNPNGERFGAADIYCAVHTMEELADYLCVGQNNLLTGDSRCILFVKVKHGYTFSEELVNKIKDQIGSDLTVEHIPEIILEVQEIPTLFSFIFNYDPSTGVSHDGENSYNGSSRSGNHETYNLNNKKMERLVRSIIDTNEIPPASNVKNPGCLKNFLRIPELQNY